MDDVLKDAEIKAAAHDVVLGPQGSATTGASWNVRVLADTSKDMHIRPSATSLRTKVAVHHI